MTYVFDYEETLSRRVRISADNLGEALRILYADLEAEKIVLSSEDFAGAKVSMPLDENPFIALKSEGEDVKDVSCMDIELDWW